MSGLEAFGPHTPQGFAQRIRDAAAEERDAEEALRLAEEELTSLENAARGGAVRGREARALGERLAQASARAARARAVLEGVRAERSDLRERARLWASQNAPQGSRAEKVCAVCGRERSERRCLGCGRRFCPSCAPNAGGGHCPRCAGPVWKDGEQRSAPVRNPQNRGY